MQEKIYLLSIEEFLTGEKGQRLMERAFERVDADRQKKVLSRKTPEAKAACLGAGLLLQLAVQQAEQQFLAPDAEGSGAGGSGADGIGTGVKNDDYLYAKFTVSRLLEEIQEPMALEFVYGENRKPYLKNSPFFFNLSHSGDYVVCVLSSREVGVDIQKHETKDVERLAKRFFAPEEAATINKLAAEACPIEQTMSYFYRLWTRKEAYGKLTGMGIRVGLNKNMLPDLNFIDDDGEVVWKEYSDIPGYSLAVCERNEKDEEVNQVS